VKASGDGHAFHERTTEQVTDRNRRDRDLHAAGWRLLPFSGSEVVNDPARCVVEVYDMAQREYQRLWSRMHDRRAQDQAPV